AALVIGAWKTTWVPFVTWISVYGAITLAAVLVSVLWTPSILRVEDPEFDTVFPVLASATLQSASVWPEHNHIQEREHAFRQ
ncbi:MAG TPA: hypothetical protein VH761_09770, partial [Ilumatobacteraceae bacterium]